MKTSYTMRLYGANDELIEAGKISQPKAHKIQHNTAYRAYLTVATCLMSPHVTKITLQGPNPTHKECVILQTSK